MHIAFTVIFAADILYIFYLGAIGRECGVAEFMSYFSIPFILILVFLILRGLYVWIRYGTKGLDEMFDNMEEPNEPCASLFPKIYTRSYKE